MLFICFLIAVSKNTFRGTKTANGKTFAFLLLVQGTFFTPNKTAGIIWEVNKADPLERHISELSILEVSTSSCCRWGWPSSLWTSTGCEGGDGHPSSHRPIPQGSRWVLWEHCRGAISSMVWQFSQLWTLSLQKTLWTKSPVSTSVPGSSHEHQVSQVPYAEAEHTFHVCN